MIDLWSKIDSWLQKNAPRVADNLANGISDETLPGYLNALTMGVSDLMDSLKVYNGQINGLLAVVDPWRLLNLSQIRVEETRLQKLFLDTSKFDPEMGSETIGPVKSDLWNKNWIPFSADDTGNFLCIDCDPDEGGTIGQVILWASDPPYVEVIAPSYRAWLEQFANDLEAGKYKWDANDESWSRVEER